MIFNSDRLAELLERGSDSTDPLVVVPQPDLAVLRSSGAGSLDLRLGTWLTTLRQSRSSVLDVSDKSLDLIGEDRLTKRYYVPFGHEFVLHPRHFVLGVTMEWIRLPRDLSGYVVGKSSWGRRGLVIATAVGVHPGFSGCLTLEITNLGEVPIKIMPGMNICQLFMHSVQHGGSDRVSKSNFSGKRKPILGEVKLDDVAKALGSTEVY